MAFLGDSGCVTRAQNKLLDPLFRLPMAMYPTLPYTMSKCSDQDYISQTEIYFTNTTTRAPYAHNSRPLLNISIGRVWTSRTRPELELGPGQISGWESASRPVRLAIRGPNTIVPLLRRQACPRARQSHRPPCEKTTPYAYTNQYSYTTR